MKVFVELNISEQDIIDCVIDRDEDLMKDWKQDPESFIDDNFEAIINNCYVKVDTKSVGED